MVNFGYPYNDIVICKDSTDYLGASPLFGIKIVKYSGVRGGGGGGGAKILQHIMAPPLPVIKIIKDCGQKYIAYTSKQYNCILSVTVTN